MTAFSSYIVMTPTATVEFIHSYGLPAAASKVIWVKYSTSSWVIDTGAAPGADFSLFEASRPSGPGVTIPTAFTRMKCPSVVLSV